MLGNIWISSALVITSIFTLFMVSKSYYDLKDAKEIQQSYELISQIKNNISSQYEKDLSEINKDEVLSFLPKNGVWENSILIDNEKELLNDDGNLIINTDDKIKVFALESKLSNLNTLNNVQESNGEKVYTITKQTFHKRDEQIKKEVLNLIESLSYVTITESLLDELILDIPSNLLRYQLLSEDENLTQEEFETKKKLYIKKLLKEKLENSTNLRDYQTYENCKDFL